ncbi:MAG: hypothetical protein ACTSU5_15030 [Promethearchaeota archaeon]
MDAVTTLKVLDGVVEVTTFAISLYSSSRIFQQYKRKRKRTSLYLASFFLLLAVIPMFQFMDTMCYGTCYAVKYGYALIVLFSAIGNIVLLAFALEVFFSGEQGIPKPWRAYFAAFASAESFFSVVGFVLKLRDVPVTTFIAVHFLVAIQLYLVLAGRSFRLASRVDEQVYRAALRSIGLFGFTFLGVYTFFILDSFSTTYTVWGLLGWICFLMTTVSGYLGFVKPMNEQDRQDKSGKKR